MSEAVGIHDHESLKLGRRPAKNAPALHLTDFLSGALPAHPAAVDHFKGQTFGLYGNDRFGDCGPVSVANLVRLVSGGLTGVEMQPSQADVFDLYRRSGNPTFNPTTGAGDEGVDMQTMLEALLAGGIGGIKPVAFAKVNTASNATLEAAVSIFGGCLWGVDLLEPQQAQTNAHPPRWDYKAGGQWGGHAILNGKFEPDGAGVDAEVISWAIDVQTTDSFRAHSLEEAWVVIWPWNLDHPAFLEGVNVQALADAYHELTGKTLPIPAPSPGPPPNPPPPGPGPATDPDTLLWQTVKHWTEEKHIGDNHTAAEAVKAWAKAKGLA